MTYQILSPAKREGEGGERAGWGLRLWSVEGPRRAVEMNGAAAARPEPPSPYPLPLGLCPGERSSASRTARRPSRYVGYAGRQPSSALASAFETRLLSA